MSDRQRDQRLELEASEPRKPSEVTVLLNRLHSEGGHGWIERAAERLTIHFDCLQAELEAAERQKVRAAEKIIEFGNRLEMAEGELEAIKGQAGQASSQDPRTP